MNMSDIGLSRKLYILFIKLIMLLATASIFLLTIFLIIYIFSKGLPNITWNLLSTTPSYITEQIGILPYILNTIYIIIVALFFTLPLGVGAAIYLTEYAKSLKLIKAIEYTTEIIAGIPSIIFGLFGMLFFCNFFGLNTSLLAGSLTLCIMNIPIVLRSTQESLKKVPQNIREGAFALGSGKWHMIRTVVLPCSLNGILTSCVLCIGRIVGESAALLFTSGFSTNLSGFFKSLFTAGATLTVSLYIYAKEQGRFDIAFAIAAILLFITFFINLLIYILGKYFKRRNYN